MAPLSEHTTSGRLREALESRGHRLTEQRAAVYRYLSRTETHPTAEEVHRAVRPGLPTISLATVYKNLETLVACGIAVKLAYSDGSSRYDGRTDRHHHTRCEECGAVRDAATILSPSTVKEIESCPDFRVTGYHLELTGLCAACACASSPRTNVTPFRQMK